ncbi:hypothetical protein PSPO01_10455 [Paraphaeosphaeria sporulosa]
MRNLDAKIRKGKTSAHKILRSGDICGTIDSGSESGHIRLGVWVRSSAVDPPRTTKGTPSFIRDTPPPPSLNAYALAASHHAPGPVGTCACEAIRMQWNKLARRLDSTAHAKFAVRQHRSGTQGKDWRTVCPTANQTTQCTLVHAQRAAAIFFETVSLPNAERGRSHPNPSIDIAALCAASATFICSDPVFLSDRRSDPG